MQKLSHDDLSTLINAVDEHFSKRYIGPPLRGALSAISLSQTFGNGVKNRTASGVYLGTQDFQPDYRSPDGTDQTHHFVAFFSGGINGQFAITTLHQAREDNKADIDLGNVAFELGASLAIKYNGLYIPDSTERQPEHPAERAKRFLGVAVATRKRICN